MEWFYANENDEQISFQESEFPELIRSGKIKRDTLVWNETLSDWTQCGPLKPDLFLDHGQPSSPSPSTSGSPPQAPDPLDLPDSGNPTTTNNDYLRQLDQQNAAAPPQLQSPVYSSSSNPVEGLSVASMVCGILGVIMCFYGIPFAIAALVCGFIGRAKLREQSLPNNGMLTAGLVLGWIGIGISFLSCLGIIVAGVAEGGFNP